MALYRLTAGGQDFVIDADLTQASAAISLDGIQTQWQTADCRHDANELCTLMARHVARIEEFDEEETEAAVAAADVVRLECSCGDDATEDLDGEYLCEECRLRRLCDDYEESRYEDEGEAAFGRED